MTEEKLDQALTEASKLSEEELLEQRRERKKTIEGYVIEFRNHVTRIDNLLEEFKKQNRKTRRANKKWLADTLKIRRQTLQQLAIMNSALGTLQDVT